MRKNESLESQLVSEILALFTADNGIKFTNLGRGFVEGSFLMLPKQDQQFLLKMKKGDLANIVIGESRMNDTGDDEFFYEGKWQKLPLMVDRFFSNIWDFTIEGDEGYTE